MKLVSTYRGRFLHRQERGSLNTKCGALPKYYVDDELAKKKFGHLPGYSPSSAKYLFEVDEIKAKRMHHCKKCFPEEFE